MSKIITTINKKMYDLTDYVDEHPGGAEIIKDYHMKDSSKAFLDIGHSEEAKNLLEKYYVKDYEFQEKEERDGLIYMLSKAVKSALFSYFSSE